MSHFFGGQPGGATGSAVERNCGLPRGGLDRLGRGFERRTRSLTVDSITDDQRESCPAIPPGAPCAGLKARLSPRSGRHAPMQTVELAASETAPAGPPIVSSFGRVD